METSTTYPQTDDMPPALALAWLGVTDVASATEGLLDRTLFYCAEKIHLHSAEAALDLLRQSDRMARWYAHHSLAEQMAGILGGLDGTVRSVFVYDLDATPEDLAFGEPTATSPIHMIVWAQRKSEALDALIEALERALVAEYASRVGPGQLEYLLDVQVIDDDDVKNGRGYAGLLRSLHNRPIRVWQRAQPQDAG
jgi:hypothetical protein